MGWEIERSVKEKVNVLHTLRSSVFLVLIAAVIPCGGRHQTDVTGKYSQSRTASPPESEPDH
jgi:hypothetical protein